MLVIYNISETFPARNIGDTLLAQNPELKVKTGDITAKLSYEKRDVPGT